MIVHSLCYITACFHSPEIPWCPETRINMYFGRINYNLTENSNSVKRSDIPKAITCVPNRIRTLDPPKYEVRS